MITLVVGHSPTLGFRMEYYASGSTEVQIIKSHTILTTAKGNLSYPFDGGNYLNNERALFPIAPSVPGHPTLRFTRVDLELGSSCQFDSIRIYNWFDWRYLQVAMYGN